MALTDLYEGLNKISKNEFEEIVPTTPLEFLTNIKVDKEIGAYLERIDDSHYLIKDKNGKEKKAYVKFIPLVDFLKFLIGKYKNEDLTILPSKDTVSESRTLGKYEKYINSVNNYAYVDSLFYYASGQLKDEHNFKHGIQCYDLFVCQKNNCRINISDDIEYLCDSNYFTENMGKQYRFEDQVNNEIFESAKKEEIDINYSDDEITLELDQLDIVECDAVMENEDISKNETIEQTIVESQEIDENEPIILDKRRCNSTLEKSDSDEEDSDSDESTKEQSDTDDDEEENSYSIEDDSEYGDENESEYDSGSEFGSDIATSDSSNSGEEQMYLLLNKFPTQVVVVEQCHQTFDNLLDKADLSAEQLESAIFQIVATLYTYQNLFDFTHNDLHTNNVMYVDTEETHITYKIMNKVYKIPTFGRIFKIIDFGRSIYTYQGITLCSDSFSPNGTAHTQYNFGPFYNSKKPIIEPNKSFDLCRLACSIFDFVCDDINNVDAYRESEPIYDLVFSWLYDDNGRNVLYKSNGDDKYPGFKLYKMISRIVHKHLPEKQFEHAALSKYAIDDDTNIDIDIDKMIE